MSDLDDLRARVEAAKDRLGKAEDQRRDQSERLIDAIQQGLDRKREELDEALARLSALEGEVATLTESLASAEARAEALAADKGRLGDRPGQPRRGPPGNRNHRGPSGRRQDLAGSRCRAPDRRERGADRRQRRAARRAKGAREAISRR